MQQKFKKNILKGSATTSIGTISGMVFQFLTIMIMTRYVSKDDFGIYVLVIVIVNMFSLLSGMGVQLTMVKFIASENKEENQDILLPVLVIRAFGSILFSAIFIIVGRFVLHLFDDRIYQYIWYIPVIFILASFRDLFYNLMQGLCQFKQYSIVNVTSSVFRVLLVFVFLLLTKLDIRILLIIEVLATLQPLLHQLFVIPFKKHLIVKPTWETYKRVIKFSIPLYLNNLVVFINGRMNIFIIAAYLNPASIANYDVATKVPVALKKIFQSFIIVYFPNLSKLFSIGDRKTAVSLIGKSLSIFSLAITLLVIFSFLFRNELTLILFSEKYVDVSLAFSLLIFNFLIRGIGDLMGYSFVPAGFPSVPTRINALAGVISVGLSLLFIPIYGYMGAVYALLIMNLISSTMFYKFLKKHKINPSLKSFLKPMLLILIVSISLLFGAEYSFVLNILLFIISLILSWFISDEFKYVLKLVFSFLQKRKWQKNSV